MADPTTSFILGYCTSSFSSLLGVFARAISAPNCSVIPFAPTKLDIALPAFNIFCPIVVFFSSLGALIGLPPGTTV